MNLDMINREIEKLEKEDTCYYTCERLAWLYIVREHYGHGYGHGAQEPVQPMDRATAESWVAGMKNVDPARPRGGRWTMDQTTALMRDKGLKYSEADWYAVLNMLYSDYGPLMSKHGPNELAAYVELARAWLDDPDAAPNKVARYYHYVAGN